MSSILSSSDGALPHVLCESTPPHVFNNSSSSGTTRTSRSSNKSSNGDVYSAKEVSRVPPLSSTLSGPTMQSAADVSLGAAVAPAVIHATLNSTPDTSAVSATTLFVSRSNPSISASSAPPGASAFNRAVTSRFTAANLTSSTAALTSAANTALISSAADVDPSAANKGLSAGIRSLSDLCKTLSAAGASFSRHGDVLLIRAPQRQQELRSSKIFAKPGQERLFSPPAKERGNALLRLPNFFSRKLMPTNPELQHLFVTAAALRRATIAADSRPAGGAAAAGSAIVTASVSSCPAVAAASSNPESNDVTAAPFRSVSSSSLTNPFSTRSVPDEESSFGACDAGFRRTSVADVANDGAAVGVDTTLSSSPCFVEPEELLALAGHPIFSALGAYLRSGGIVSFSTETVYGLGAAATIPTACDRIYHIKKRPPTDPLICHVASVEQALHQAFDLRAAFPHTGNEKEDSGKDNILLKKQQQISEDLQLLIETLAAAFWPGPLSIIGPAKVREDRTDNEGVALSVTSNTRLVAVRCPNNANALALILAAGVPLAAPSANRFGRISPTLARHVLNQFAIDDSSVTTEDAATTKDSTAATARDETAETFVLLDGDGEADRCCMGIESTVVKIVPPFMSKCFAETSPSSKSENSDSYEFQILRRGVITRNMVDAALKAAAARHNEKQQQQGHQQEKQHQGEDVQGKHRLGAEANSVYMRPFPHFTVTVSEKLQYHLEQRRAAATVPLQPNITTAATASAEAHGAATMETPVALELTLGAGHAPAAAESTALDAGKESVSMESPGMALTHYAPCLPCFLVSAAALTGSAAATLSELPMPQSAAVAHSPHLMCSCTILIDADSSFAPVSDLFLRYYPLRALIELPVCRSNDADCTPDVATAAAAILLASSEEKRTFMKSNKRKICGDVVAVDANRVLSSSADDAGAAVEVEDKDISSSHTADSKTAVAVDVKRRSVSRVSDFESDSATLVEAEGFSKIRSGAVAKGTFVVPPAGVSEAAAAVQAAACSIFETLHTAEAAALHCGAQAIMIHAEPLLKYGEHGYAVYDRLYRAASGKHATVKWTLDKNGKSLLFFTEPAAS